MNMNRREFSQAATGAAGMALASSTLWTGLAHAQAKKPEAGKDYLVIDPRATVDAPAGKVEVVEFFGYFCPHCNSFEPTLSAWLKTLPAHVAFRRAHVAFNDAMAPQQRLFLALDAMGLVEKMQVSVFSAIHKDKLKLNTRDEIVEWVVKQGVDKAKFLENYNSFSIATKASRMTQLQNAYKLEGVPALGIAGRFYIDGTLAGSMPRVLQIADYLITEVKAGR